MIGGAPWLFLRGDWRVAQIDSALRSFARAKAAQDCADISMAELEAADSVMLAVLMVWVQQARQRGATLRIHDVSPALLELANLYRLQDILPLHDE